MSDSDASRNSASNTEDGAVRRVENLPGPLDAFKNSIKLFFTKDIGLLSLTFFFMGKLRSILKFIFHH
jgi:hypothetical protein